jgi:transposase
MSIVTFVGLDVHKKSISYCLKRADGEIVGEGEVEARRAALTAWAKQLPQPWHGAMEATLFSSWIYHHLKPLAAELKMGNPARMKAISSGKKKNDRLDARTIADLLRANLLPVCWVPPADLEHLRRQLRFRGLLVRQYVLFKNKISGLLLETGVAYETRRLHGQRYFAQLQQSEEVAAEIKSMLKFSRSQIHTLRSMDRQLIGDLRQHPLISERVSELEKIAAVGKILALSWVLEIGDPERMPSIGDALSYCGLTSAQYSSAGKDRRGPISKQRNKHIQRVLVEAAKTAPQWNKTLKAVHDREVERGHKNRASLAVARKLVAYLLAVDRATVRRQRLAPEAHVSAEPKPNRAA